jgi:hypothetical protein
MKAANKIFSLPFALATSAALLVGTGGCSDRNRDLIEASGLAIDGYLQSATVCVDINGDKQCSDNEPSDTTDANGQFALGTFQSAPLLVGITPGVTTDSPTQGVAGSAIEHTFFLTAPLNSSSITPLTTLVQVGVEQGFYTNFASGASTVATALNIPTGTDIQNYDYLSRGDVKVATAAKIVTNAIASAIVNMQTNVTSTVATTENIFETSVKVLVDPNLAGGVGTSLMDEIGVAVNAAVADGTAIVDVDFAMIETAIDAAATTASEVDATTLEAAIEETNAVNQAGGATGSTGATGAN